MSTFSESHLDVPDPLQRVVSCPTPRLPSTSRAASIPSSPRRSCSATLRGMNESVCTQSHGVAFGEVEKTPHLGCFLTPECFDIEVVYTVYDNSRHVPRRNHLAPLAWGRRARSKVLTTTSNKEVEVSLWFADQAFTVLDEASRTRVHLPRRLR